MTETTPLKTRKPLNLKNGDIVNNGIKFINLVSVTKNYLKICKFQCHCGNYFVTRLSHVKNSQKSCGCLNKPPPINIKHGQSNRAGYKTWDGMMSRCYNENHIHYDNYGGRGIFVCSAWHDPSVFLDWFDKSRHGSGENLQIDRENNDDGYSPNNCRLVNSQVNSENRRGTKWWYTPDGTFPSLKKASEHYGVWLKKRFVSRNYPEFYTKDKYLNEND